MKLKYKCLKCGDILMDSLPLSRCPLSGCNGDVRLLEEHLIFVRDRSNTYIARANGKSASCTAGPEQAATALAKKLFNHGQFIMKAINKFTYLATEEGK